QFLSPSSPHHRALPSFPTRRSSDLGAVDVVMPLIHGPFGEDGTLQGMLEMSDVRYVGAGVLASAVGMDKHYMKVVCESEGLAVRSEEHTSELQSRENLVCRLLLEKK